MGDTAGRGDPFRPSTRGNDCRGARVLDPFPDTHLLDDPDRLSTWLAEEESISSRDLACLLRQMERSVRLLQQARVPVPIRTLYAMRLIRSALEKRRER